jgi:hypothetical protein
MRARIDASSSNRPNWQQIIARQEEGADEYLTFETEIRDCDAYHATLLLEAFSGSKMQRASSLRTIRFSLSNRLAELNHAKANLGGKV